MTILSARPASAPGGLGIVHVFRAPLGGLFRHVIDLAGEQARRGHRIGMVFDRGGLCARVEEALGRIPGGLALGVATVPIARRPALSDLAALAELRRFLRDVRPDVVHGHGSKGGALARASRLVGAAPGAIRVYTPHGGSFNYRPGGLPHRVYMAVERALAPLTDAFLFESAYVAARFDAEVGARARVRRIIVNGLGPRDFERAAPGPDAAEFFYVGELRAAKGLDTLVEAFARLSRERAKPPRLALIGGGPERDRIAALGRTLGVGHRIVLPGPTPFRRAAALGRILVVPSRAESLPYVVLEAAGAAVPLVATDVGGIPEIFGPYAGRLGPPGDPADLARRMAAALDQDPLRREEEADALRRYVAEKFTLDAMADAVIGAYREAIALTARGRFAAHAAVNREPA